MSTKGKSGSGAHLLQLPGIAFVSRMSRVPTTGQAGTRLVWNTRGVLLSSREARPHVVPGKPTAARVLEQTQMQGVRSQTADLGLAQSGKRHRPANKAYQSARFPLKPQVDNCEVNGSPKLANQVSLPTEGKCKDIA